MEMKIAALAGQSEAFIKEAEGIAYGGITAALNCPDEVLNEICKLRKKTTYVCMLAHALHEQIMVSDQSMTATLKATLSRMDEQVNKVALLHTWLLKVISQTDKYATGPVELPRN